MLRTFSFFLLIGSISACGLKYEPQTMPEDQKLNRQKAVELMVEQEFSTKGMTYKSLAFGQTAVLKPQSYKVLDSLFAEKYKLEQEGRNDRYLNEAIEVQQIICQRDTNTILYRENHVFSLTYRDTAQIINGIFDLNKNNELKNVKFEEAVYIDKELVPFYTYYLFEGSFLYPGYSAETRETAFYRFYREKLAVLSGSQKDTYLEHMLRLMSYAKRKKTLENTTLAKEVVKQVVHKGSNEYKEENFPRIDALYEGNRLVGYDVIYQVSEPNLQGTWERMEYSVILDDGLFPSEMKKTILPY